MRATIIGAIDAETVQLLNLSIAPNTPIYLGDSNFQHMQSSHPEAFVKYYSSLSEILAHPDYVNLNPRDGSIKYLKKINDIVVVGVRISAKGKLFARTIFTFEPWKFSQYLSGGYLKKHT